MATNVVAYYGAGLSTILMLIKLWEIRRDRLKLEISHNFADVDEIFIHNPSKVGVIITHFELSWIRKRLFKKDVVLPGCYSDFSEYNLHLDPVKTITLTFEGENQIMYYSNNKDRGELHIRLKIAGRRKMITKSVIQEVIPFNERIFKL